MNTSKKINIVSPKRLPCQSKKKEKKTVNKGKIWHCIKVLLDKVRLLLAYYVKKVYLESTLCKVSPSLCIISITICDSGDEKKDQLNK